MKIAIAGAGIGGLTAAMCLHRAGFDVAVFEAVSELRPRTLQLAKPVRCRGILLLRDDECRHELRLVIDQPP